MTLVYVPCVGLYIGWHQSFAARKLHFCCSKSSLSAAFKELELVWEWSDP